MNPRPKVSLVICTLNRAKYLCRAIDSLEYLNYDNFEVVVVNGPSSDSTHEVLRRYEGRIKTGQCQSTNIARSRNIGIDLSSGEIVAFLDDDCIPWGDWLKNLVVPYKSKKIAGSGGSVFEASGFKVADDVPFLFNRFGVKVDLPIKEGVNNWIQPPHGIFLGFPTMNVSFRKSSLREVGGFDEEFEYYLEDADLCLRLKDGGYDLAYSPKSIVHHFLAPGHARDPDRKLRLIYPILKNAIYFALKNSVSTVSASGVRKWFEATSQRIQKNPADYFGDKLRYPLPEETSAIIKKALLDGFERGMRARQNSPPRQKFLERTPFKLFGPKNQKTGAACVVLPPEFSRKSVSSVSLSDFPTHLGLHIIKLKSSRSRSDFRDGVWHHQSRDENSANALARINYYSRVEIVCHG